MKEREVEVTRVRRRRRQAQAWLRLKWLTLPRAERAAISRRVIVPFKRGRMRTGTLRRMAEDPAYVASLGLPEHAVSVADWLVQSKRRKEAPAT